MLQWALAFPLALAAAVASSAVIPSTPFTFGSSWKYLATGADLTTANWAVNDYDDSTWQTGRGTTYYWSKPACAMASPPAEHPQRYR